MTVYSLPVSEVVSAGPGRVIVEIGAETRVNQARPPHSRSVLLLNALRGRACAHSLRFLRPTQISASLLQRLKLAELPWCAPHTPHARCIAARF